MPLRLTRLTTAIFMAGLVTSASAHAVTLPWLEDPWQMEKEAASYGARLRPAHCPDLTRLDHKLTVNEVVLGALCHNPNTRASFLTLMAQAQSSGTSYSGYLPNVDVGADVTNDRIFRQRTGTNTNFRDGTNSSSFISAEMVLFDFGRREATVQSAEQALAAAGNTYDSQLQGTIAAALQGYYRLLTSQNGVTAAEESERFAKASYDAAQLRHQIGQVAIADELQAKGSYSQALLASQQARNQHQQDKGTLALLIGLTPDAAVEVAEMDDKNLGRAPFGDHVKKLMEEALSNRTDLAAKRARVAQAQADYHAIQRSDLPRIAASAGSDFGTADPFNRSSSREQTVGLSVSIPIFTGFTQTYNEGTARRLVEVQQAELAQNELTVGQDVWNAWHNYETAKQSWDTSVDLLASATELRDVALGRYKEGVGSILDVLNAQSQYSGALQSQLQARYNLLTTRVDLVRAVGLLDLSTMRPETGLSSPVAEEYGPPAPPALTAPKPDADQQNN